MENIKKEKLIELLMGENKWDIIDKLMQESPAIFTHVGVIFDYSWNNQGYTFVVFDKKTFLITSLVLIVLLIKSTVKYQALELATNENQLLIALEKRGQPVSYENIADIQEEAFNVITYVIRLMLRAIHCLLSSFYF